jgi:hypothetical protein
MMLPNRERAHIPRSKLIKYLLSETHPVGRSKARYFRSHGYTEVNIDLLGDALLAIARHQEVKEESVSSYGIKYIVEGEINSPNGTTLRIRTVWIVEPHDEWPRFVTAYPA